MIVLPRRCVFPGCTRRGDHRHHIVYFPERVVKILCREHHAEITMLNGIHARRVRHQLATNHRWWLWYQWIAGNLKPRRTRKALEYVEEWGREPVSPLLMAGPTEVPEKRRRNISGKRAMCIAKPRRRTAAKKKRRSGE